MVGAGTDDRWLLAILHVPEKLCAESAHNHSVQTPLAREKKTQPGKSQNHVVVLCGTLSPSNGFIRLTRWRFGLTTVTTLVYQYPARVEEQKDEKNAREEQCPVKIEPDP
jgi:uncharacterized membrane protein affecting hemolysin expression